MPFQTPQQTLIGPFQITPETPLRSIPFVPPLEAARDLALRLSLNVTQEFTDNANETPDNRKSEFGTHISPGLSLRLDRASSSLNLTYTPSFFISDNGVQSNSVNQYASLRGTWNPGPYLRLGVADDVTYSTDFLALGNIGSRRTGTNPYFTNHATIEAAYIPPQGRIALSYSNTVNQQYDVQIPDNSLTQTVRTDGELNGPRYTLSGSYWVSRGDFQVSSAYWENNLEARFRHIFTPSVSAALYGLITYHNADQPLAQDFIIGRAGPVVNWAYGPSGTVEAGAGIAVFSPQNSTPLQSGNTDIRPTFHLRWTQAFNLVAISAAYDQAYDSNFQSIDSTGVSFTRSASLSVSTTSAAFRDLTASIGAQWVENQFKQNRLVGGSLLLAGTTDRTFNIDARLRYYIFRPVSLTLGYIFTIRNSTDPTKEFYENRVQFGLSYQYDVF